PLVELDLMIDLSGLPFRQLLRSGREEVADSLEHVTSRRRCAPTTEIADACLFQTYDAIAPVRPIGLDVPENRLDVGLANGRCVGVQLQRVAPPDQPRELQKKPDFVFVGALKYWGLGIEPQDAGGPA